MPFDIHIIGGGLAGSEAAWQLAEAGLRVRLSEMRGSGDTTAAHESDNLAEMVCSNSFRSDDAENNAVGLLHQEMRDLGSLIMRCADEHRVPAGSALAVDREIFAAEVTRAIQGHPNVEVMRERIDALPDHPTIIATGPLTGSALAEAIAAETGEGTLAFFDAIAPIVHRDSIDMDVAWMAARWDKGGKDYINCPLDKAQYDDFVAALIGGEKMSFKEWEKDTPYFEGCMPIEVMAERGPETLRYGPMKGVGLDNPRTGRWPYAVVQLRQDNALGTLWNIFTKALFDGRPIPLFNRGELRRDFTYIDDIVWGVVACLDQPPLDDGSAKAGGSAAPHAIYNIGNSRSEEVRRVIQLLEQATGCRASIEELPMQPGDVKETYADVSATERDLGFRPSTPIEEGVPKFVGWFRDYHSL